MKITKTKDYETIARLNKNVQDVHAELYPEHFLPYKYEPIRDFFKEILNDQNQIFLLAEIDTTPIGYVWMTIREPSNPFKKTSKSLYIHQISLDKHHSNKGAGSQLMTHVEQLAKEIGATRLELDYWIQNTIARNFYEKVGFFITKEVVHKELN